MAYGWAGQALYGKSGLEETSISILIYLTWFKASILLIFLVTVSFCFIFINDFN